MISKCLCLLLLALPLNSIAQVDSAMAAHEVPRLVSADLPKHPPIAEAAHYTGQVTVRVTVNSGKVVRAEAVKAELKDRSYRLVPAVASLLLTSPTVENIESWRFDNSVNDIFSVRYTYEISGSETDSPTNPKVEMLPSLDVKITVRPVKPTINY